MTETGAPLGWIDNVFPPDESEARTFDLPEAPRSLTPAGEDLEEAARALREEAAAHLFGPVEILRREKYAGPRYSTGIGALDDLLGGGLAPGWSFAVSGEPFAGKTLLMGQIVTGLSLQGAAVAILANDEDRVGPAQRIGQNLGFAKEELSPLYPNVLEELRKRLARPVGPIRLYPAPDEPVTVEKVARDLANMDGAFPALLVDSIQTVRVAAHEDDDPEPVAIKKTVEALKAIKKAGILVLATSEAPRGAYGSKDPSQRTRALASFAGSRKVEFLFDVAAFLSSDDAPDTMRLEMPKNRLGHRRGMVGLRLDRERARFVAVDLREAEKEREAHAEQAREELRHQTRQRRREKIIMAIRAASDPAGVSLSRLREQGCGRAADLSATLDAMVEEGLLESTPGSPGARGGRPALRYRLKVPR